MYTLTETKSTEFKVQTITNTMHSIAEYLTAENANKKQVAVYCAELKNSAQYETAFGKMKFTAVIEKYFGTAISGATAYKYAQIAEELNNPENQEYFECLPIGKLVILLNVCTKKAKAKNATPSNFFYNAGRWLNHGIEQEYNAWQRENSETLSAINTLIENGLLSQADSLRATLKNEPQKPAILEDFDGNDIEFDEYMENIGFGLFAKVSDKDSKMMIDRYLTDIGAKSEKASNEKASDENASGENEGAEVEKVKTLADFKADAIAALTAYITALEQNGETTPKTIEKAVMTLKSE